MLALRYYGSITAQMWARSLGRRSPEAATSTMSPLRLSNVPAPKLPGPDWLRLRPRLSGICGSDLAALRGQASLYLATLTSFPFVPGHEVVAEVTASDREVTFTPGQRVVLEPALGCLVRGLDPLCRNCASGLPGLCERIDEGAIGTGLQTGFCRDTSGGWSQGLVAHVSQLHPIPDSMDDATAVLVEPLACCIHAVLGAGLEDDGEVLVLGCGAVGLLTIVALARLHPKVRILASAKYPHQAELAMSLGAERVVKPSSLQQRVRYWSSARRITSAFGPSVLLGGFATVFDCVGSSASLSDAVGCARARGQVVMVGMPGEVRVDLAAVWQRELSVRGTYAYGLEVKAPAPRLTFTMALEMLQEVSLGHLVGPEFGLRQYREAMSQALDAGRLGLTKIVFRPEQETSQMDAGS